MKWQKFPVKFPVKFPAKVPVNFHPSLATLGRRLPERRDIFKYQFFFLKKYFLYFGGK